MHPRLPLLATQTASGRAHLYSEDSRMHDLYRMCATKA